MATLTNSNPNESCCHQDRHKAPASTQPFPLSLQDRGLPLPDSVVKVHQEGSGASRTGTRPPLIPTSAPCPYRTAGRRRAVVFCYSLIRCACPGWGTKTRLRITAPSRIVVRRGQAPGPRIHSTPPLVPHIIDGRGRPLAKSKGAAGLVAALGEPPFVPLACASPRQ
jgi:hypothetical protein